MDKNRLSWPFRTLSLLLAGLQSIIPIIPVAILTGTGPRVYAEAPNQQPPSPPRQITHRPSFEEPLPALPNFSSPPTVAEFFSVHFFQVPLVPVGIPGPEENYALAGALKLYASRSNIEDQTALLNYLKQYPQSAWKPALLVNLGLIWRQTGYFSKARDAWTKAWNLSKQATEIKSRTLADRSLGELVQLDAWIGGYDELQLIFNEIGNRKLTGKFPRNVARRPPHAWFIGHENHSPEKRFFPVAALLLSKSYWPSQNPGTNSAILMDAKSSRQGVSLAQLKTLADQAGMHMQIAKRSPGSDFVAGSVVHWKLNHYGALLEENHGRYLIGDATFNEIYGRQLWISKAALEEESDGYFLVPDGKLPDGWQKVSMEEAKNVWGKGTAVDRE